MNNEIKILHASYIPLELIQEFTSEIGTHESPASLEVRQQEEKYVNFIGPEFSDIIIFIRQHATDISVNAFLAPMIYDIIKTGLPKLWAKFSKKPVTMVSSNRQQEKTKRISLLIKKDDSGVEIVFEGNVDDPEAQRLVETALEYCNSDKMQADLQNEELQEKPGEHKIRITFNMQNNKWEPKNFDDHRRAIEALRKAAMQKTIN